MGQFADAQTRDAIRQAPPVIKAANLHLESPKTWVPLSSPNRLGLDGHLQRESSHGVASTDAEDCITTTTAHERTSFVPGVLSGAHEPEQVAPSSSSFVPPSRLPRNAAVSTKPPSSNNSKSTINLSAPIADSQQYPERTLPSVLSSLYNPQDGAAGSNTTLDEGNMKFAPYAMGAGSASHRRRQYANTSALTDYEADLTGADRAKQKEAVRRFLTENIKDDWTWQWPRPEPGLEESNPNLSKENSPEAAIEEHWKERDEWISNASDSGGEETGMALKGVQQPDKGTNKVDPFRFESPDGVDETIKKGKIERKRRRKKRLVEEMAWNDGLRCFVARRDAWTGARHVSRSGSAKLGFSPIVTTQVRNPDSLSSEDGGSSTAIEHEPSEVEEEWVTDTEVPVAAPLIPPTNAMRTAINPTAYNTIYDKVILQQLSPSCPINLKDVTRSCVQGWKRDGEWPPKSSVPDIGRRRRRLSMASLFGLEKSKSKEDKEILEKERVEKEAEKSSGDGKPGSFRRSLQKILNLRKEKERDSRRGSNGSAKEVVLASPG